MDFKDYLEAVKKPAKMTGKRKKDEDAYIERPGTLSDQIEFSKAQAKLPSCSKCKYLLQKDDGYSDYTVTGVDYHCLKDSVAFKKLEKQSGGENEMFKLIERPISCKIFKKGEPTNINVEFYKDDALALVKAKPEIYRLAAKKGLVEKEEDLI